MLTRRRPRPAHPVARRRVLFQFGTVGRRNRALGRQHAGRRAAGDAPRPDEFGYRGLAAALRNDLSRFPADHRVLPSLPEFAARTDTCRTATWLREPASPISDVAEDFTRNKRLRFSRRRRMEIDRIEGSGRAEKAGREPRPYSRYVRQTGRPDGLPRPIAASAPLRLPPAVTAWWRRTARPSRFPAALRSAAPGFDRGRRIWRNHRAISWRCRRRFCRCRRH